MFCEKCGKENSADAVICEACGEKMPEKTMSNGFADILEFEEEVHTVNTQIPEALSAANKKIESMQQLSEKMKKRYKSLEIVVLLSMAMNSEFFSLSSRSSNISSVISSSSFIFISFSLMSTPTFQA